MAFFYAVVDSVTIGGSIVNGAGVDGMFYDCIIIFNTIIGGTIIEDDIVHCAIIDGMFVGCR
jgi:hypothetical protein